MKVRLEGQGITGAALELILDMTAPARHQARVEMVLSTLSHLPKPVAALTLVLDTIGIGGRKGLEGRGTSRLPILSKLGKGRKQASDGDAWSAAITGALYTLLLRGDTNGTLVIGPTTVSVDWGSGEDDPEPNEFGWVTQEVIPALWARSLAGNVILHLGTGEPLPPSMGGLPIRLEGTLAGWSTVFNQCEPEKT